MTIPETYQAACRCRESGRWAEAESLLREVLAADPNHAPSLQMLAALMHRADRLEEAERLMRRAIAAQPNIAEYHSNLGTALSLQRRIDEAVAAFTRALELKPDDPSVLCNLGAALVQRGDSQRAIAVLRRALELRPQFPQALCNLGGVLSEVGDFPQSIQLLRQALALQPNYPRVMINLGYAYYETGRFEQALEIRRRAHAMAPDDPETRWNLAVALMLSGRLEEGWPGYESRWGLRLSMTPHGFEGPRWDGSPLNGRRILIHSEQGLGDTIQFVRHVPMVVARGGRVILRCQPELRRLLDGQCEIERVVTASDPMPQFDAHCPLLSLPVVFNTTMADIPAPSPYLRARPSWIEPWRIRSPELNVGLNWAGSRLPVSNRKRTIGLAAFEPLARIPGVRFHSLQKGEAAAEARTPPAGMTLIDRTDELHDMADTAGLIANLDLVITNDTSVAHLAGALGAATWLLLPFAPDWRWFLNRSDSPWYPTMRLFRQPAIGDWASPMNQVAEELHRLVADRLRSE